MLTEKNAIYNLPKYIVKWLNKTPLDHFRINYSTFYTERIKLNTTTFFVGLGIAFYVITCLAIFDIAKKDFGKLAYKFIWGIIALIPFIGCIIYFVFGYRKGKRISRYSSL
ncbi:MAG: PLDc_N domain-containing protein [Desulfobacteraceae bacterium]|nr:PLDc_N domain-containing protein [Desulfobacteraceae bacterium]MBC2719931.1 PLDc_N domain-containing protein [Desulfobacteraceae bacterium]